ncbi:hypothetical protein [Oryzobacter terrae]|uniref:DMP19 family protein n=1 Tax=Oryzobacter terrae TaxID=1620385 RepID=UPI0036711DC8
MSDDDYFVENTLGWLARDLDDDDGYDSLTEPERTATLAWVLDRTLRSRGIVGWVTGHGPRSDDALAALRAVGAGAHADALEPGLQAYPDRADPDPEARFGPAEGEGTGEAGAATPVDSEAAHRAESAYLALTRRDDVVERHVRPFIEQRPKDFPQDVDDL